MRNLLFEGTLGGNPRRRRPLFRGLEPGGETRTLNAGTL
nr:hypothetical protein JVH1_3422 [Rhodococcus sp. JVH1]